MEKAYKQDNPNELANFVSVESDCPITEAEAVTILEGTFVRSRIKPLGNSAWMFRELYLSVVLTCLPLKGQNPVYSIDVRFGVPFPEYAMHYAVDYGVIGIGPKSMAKSGLQDSVERAVQVTESDCWRRSGSGPVADILKNARYTIGFNCIRP